MKVATLTVLVFCFVFPASAQKRQVDRIDITSTWGGLGTPQKSRIAIVRKGSEFIADGKKVNPVEIEALLKALEESDIEKPTLENLGITQSWLSDNAQSCMNDCVNGYIYRSIPAQKLLFVSKFSDTKFAQEQIEEMFRGGFWTDDYPRFEAHQIQRRGRDQDFLRQSVSVYDPLENYRRDRNSNDL
jgi:hypothetical protein